jgi:hypothetical protein
MKVQLLFLKCDKPLILRDLFLRNCSFSFTCLTGYEKDRLRVSISLHALGLAVDPSAVSQDECPIRPLGVRRLA